MHKENPTPSWKNPTPWEMSKEFADTFGVPYAEDEMLRVPSREEILLGVKLVLEEFVSETLSSLVTDESAKTYFKMMAGNIQQQLERSLDPTNIDFGELGDGVVDTSYVLLQMARRFGIPHDTLFTAVHEKNMDKIPADGIPLRREDGKIMKREGWCALDVPEFLRAYVHPERPIRSLG